MSILEYAPKIGAILTCCGTLGGGYVYLDGPLPASRNYVLALEQGLKMRVIDSQLQANSIERRLLRKEKFDRTLEIEKSEDPNVRNILRGRLDQIADEEEAANRERQSLEREKRK
jgi:hypothetical protein